MIDREDLASFQEGYDELLASEVAQRCAIDRPTTTRSALGGVNRVPQGLEYDIPCIVDDINAQQWERYKDVAGAERKDLVKVVILPFGVGAQAGDTIILENSKQLQVRVSNIDNTLKLNEETICVLYEKLSKQ